MKFEIDIDIAHTDVAMAASSYVKDAIKANQLQMLDGKPRDDQQPEQPEQPAQRQSGRNSYSDAREGRMPPASPPADAFDDDIPFADPYHEMWRAI